MAHDRHRAGRPDTERSRHTAVDSTDMRARSRDQRAARACRHAAARSLPAAAALEYSARSERMFGITYTPAEEAFRAELRAWLEANLPRAPVPEDEDERRRFQRAWQRALAAGGWVGIQWPRAHGGRGASPPEQIIFTQEMARARAPQIPDPGSGHILGPTPLPLGT